MQNILQQYVDFIGISDVYAAQRTLYPIKLLNDIEDERKELEV